MISQKEMLDIIITEAIESHANRERPSKDIGPDFWEKWEKAQDDELAKLRQMEEGK